MIPSPQNIQFKYIKYQRIIIWLPLILEGHNQDSFHLVRPIYFTPPSIIFRGYYTQVLATNSQMPGKNIE